MFKDSHFASGVGHNNAGCLFIIRTCKQSHTQDLPREMMQGGARLLWGPGDRMRLLSKLRI